MSAPYPHDYWDNADDAHRLIAGARKLGGPWPTAIRGLLDLPRSWVIDTAYDPTTGESGYLTAGEALRGLANEQITPEAVIDILIEQGAVRP